jgi:hypothetical protein
MIAQTISLALAPVFLLVAMGNILNVLSQRLGRVVDRSRLLQERHKVTSGDEHDMIVREIRLTDLRISLIGRAILCIVLAGLTVGATVALLFVEEMVGVDLQMVVAGTFMLAIALLMIALLLFLKEVRAGTSALRIPEEFLETHRKL